MSAINLQNRNILRFCLYIGLALHSAIALGESQYQAQLNEDKLLLLDTRLNADFIVSSLEAYEHQGQIFVSVEPLFDALSLRYQLYSDRLLIWKNDQEYQLSLDDPVASDFFYNAPVPGRPYWANDGFSTFIDLDILGKFFEISITPNLYQQQLVIRTQDDVYLFPIQVLEQQKEQRALAAAVQSAERLEYAPPPITLEDQYRIATIPHGRISASMLWNNSERDERFSAQLTSDLLWHSADLTIGKTSDQDFSSNLKLSRYKTLPNELIIGLFDSYSFGDVSSFSNNLTTSTTSGLGAVFEREPENFRRRNLAVTLEETAPPGWEAELFRNNEYIETVTVPDDGQLIFEDVPTEFGQNYYQIKLYGPYGEETILEKYLPLNANALAGGEVAYNLYALDNQHQVINDKNNAERDVTDYGGTFDIGINDHWQLGVGFASTNTQTSPSNQTGEENYLYSLKNAFSLPGLLIENDISVNEDDGYAQLSSIIGNDYFNHNYTLAYESADEFKSPRVDALSNRYERYDASYSGTLGFWSFVFNGDYTYQNLLKNNRVSNRLSRSYKMLYFSHSISYSHIESFNATTNSIESRNQLLGSLSLAGRVTPALRITGVLNYDPDDDDVFLDDASLTSNWSPIFFDEKNYFTWRYLPLTNSSNNWSLSHRIAWDRKDFQLTYTSSYDALDNWSLSTGIRFFLGYDRHNHRTYMRSNTPIATATLDIHSYLDRQANGQYDVLDHHLEDVRFIGNPDWEGVTSGKEGRTILPGVGTQGPFYFEAEWREGSKTHNSDYVVFTHPGAYIDVNMPFHLSSEITGFVERAGTAAPLAKVKIELEHLNETHETETDPDGYYEFLDIMPGEYTVRIKEEYLRENGYTSDIVGYTVRSLRTGGFTELDIIELSRAYDSKAIREEKVVPFETTENNSEAIIEHKTKEEKQTLFMLPHSQIIDAPHTKSDAEDKRVTLHPMDELSIQTDTAPVLVTPTKIKSPQKNSLPSISLGNTKNNTLAKKDSSSDDTLIASSKTAQKGKRYTIQLGAVNSKSAANALQQKIKRAHGLDAKIQSGQSNGSTIYRVTIGTFKSRKEAKQFAKSKLSDTDIYIRKRYANE